MWVRDHYFPVEYAHASWDRLQAFFQLSGQIIWGQDKSRLNSSDLTTVPSTEIWKCCVQRLSKNNRAYQMDAVFSFVCKVPEILHLDAQEKEVA